MPSTSVLSLASALIASLSVCGTATAQWPEPVLDAPLVVLSNNSRSMVELLDIDGNGALEALTVRIDMGPTVSYMTVTTMALQAGAGGLRHFATVPTAGGMEPFSAIGQLWSADGFDDAAIGAGTEVWLFRGSTGGVGAPTASLTVNGPLRGVAIADFDGDGLGDLATLTDQELTVHRAGAVPVTSPVSLTLPAGSGAHILRAEVDGDGTADLVVVGDRADFYRFTGTSLMSLGSLAVGMANPMPVAGDIDSDGDEDLVVFGDTEYVVLRRNGVASFAVEPRVVGGPATHLYDVDGDGDLDGACCGGGGGGPPAILYQPATFRVSINQSGVFAPAYELHGIGAWHLAGVTDVDLDGNLDLVAGRAIYFARQSLAIPPHDPGPGGPVSPQTVFDLDADGDLDWATDPAEIHWNRGDGQADVTALPLLAPTSPGTAYGPPMVPGDFDGDGDTDLIVEVTRGGAPVGTRLLLQRGGVFADGGEPLPSGVTMSPWIGDDPARIVTADFDGDGDLDFAANSPGSPYWSYLWYNGGTGVFQFAFVQIGECVVACEDFTGDGLPDLVVSDGRLLLRRGVTGGGFGAVEGLTGGSYPYFNRSNTFDPLRDSLAHADFDGDGVLDIVAAERSATGGCFPVLLRGRGAARPAFVSASGPGGLNGINSVEPARILTDDLDGDGNPDVLVSNPFNAGWNGVGVAFGTGTFLAFDGSRTQQLLAPVAALGDLDADGDVDTLGEKLVQNRIFEGLAAGSRRQWGAGTAGTAGIVPRLGAAGPVRAGSVLELLASGAAGQSCGVIVFGSQTRSLPLFGGTSYVEPAAWTLVCTQGTAGLAGDGRCSLLLPPLPANLAGLTFHLHAGFGDSAQASGLALSNALTLRIGQ